MLTVWSRQAFCRCLLRVAYCRRWCVLVWRPKKGHARKCVGLFWDTVWSRQAFCRCLLRVAYCRRWCVLVWRPKKGHARKCVGLFWDTAGCDTGTFSMAA